jgi:hypothetical protein
MCGKAYILLAGMIILLHAILLAVGGSLQSATWDEFGHLVSGVENWKSRRFDLYRVNPPLVRMTAAVPVAVAGVRVDRPAISGGPDYRPEWPVAREFVSRQGQRSLWYLKLARWACVPYSVLGAVLCGLWARQSYGNTAALLACALWCFSPTILGHGALITPDVGAAAVGVAALYLFRQWLLRPSWLRAVLAGSVVGLAASCKFTWIILFGLLPIVWGVVRVVQGLVRSGHDGAEDKCGSEGPKVLMQTLQLFFMLTVALYVVNMLFGFEGSFQRLGRYQFVSRALGRVGSPLDSNGMAGGASAGKVVTRTPLLCS